MSEEKKFNKVMVGETFLPDNHPGLPPRTIKIEPVEARGELFNAVKIEGMKSGELMFFDRHDVVFV